MLLDAFSQLVGIIPISLVFGNDEYESIKTWFND